ncbi:serine protease [Streptomyces spinoverrucosus]|uniref:SSI family serine proteinase inhibitor n=1 Tax=Streptomyces spinoverrucosus TaxID=284043 RepID=UPI0018C432F9|nr:SSI family serine proteinase inhibitor [Streptomyces spinoverrucosus]MBG0851680.1 serine protease [Streptomyces spinoverrucosus]
MTYTLTTKAVRGGLLAAAALLAVGAAPAPATAQESRVSDWLYLSVIRGDARSSDTSGTLLMCDPPQGHRRAAEACTQLDAVHGDISRMPLKHAYCTMVHAPVTVHARGQWRGQPVDYRQTFSNDCEMEARTGAVFALDG